MPDYVKNLKIIITQEASRPESSAAFKIKNLYMILGIYCTDTVLEYS